MIFKDWTYKKKNQALLGLAIALLVLSWYLAFGKTYRLVAEYRELRAGMAIGNENRVNASGYRDRLAMQDSLLGHYTADSTVWVSGLLVQVGEVLDGYSIGVSFENRPIGTGTTVVERELVLEGSFATLQQALEALEEKFFIKSIQAYVEKEQLKYSVKLTVVKEGR